MKTSVLTFLAVVFLPLFLSGCKENKPELSEDSFLGEWYTIKGDVEAYSFLKDSSSYIFVGTRDMRPVVYGTWKINKNKFIIMIDNGTALTYHFSLSNDTLIFNGGEEIYTRTEPLEVKYPEVRILVNISSDFRSLKFSAPRPADLNWNSWIDSTQTFQNFPLKGYSISAGTIMSSDVLTEISNYLEDYGFESDTVSVTANCSGFRDDNQLVTVCAGHDSKSAKDSIYILITSAFIGK